PPPGSSPFTTPRGDHPDLRRAGQKGRKPIMPCVVPRVSLKCEHCFETFLRMQCELTRGRGRFCSKRCLYNSRIVRVSLTCMACGVSFERKASEADRHEGAYCSRSCYESHRKENAHCYPKIAGVHAHRVVAEQKLGRKL